MEKISRRGALGAVSGAFASGLLVSRAVAEGDAKDKAEPAKGAAESPYKFRLGEAEARTYGDSSNREHTLRNFPMSSTMAAALITLAPGDIREPHWHPNSDEWLMVMHGKISMTVVNGKGEASHFTCGPNDVASTPQGFGHYVENISDGDTLVIVVHNHAEFTTVNLSEWVAGGSNSVFTTALGLPPETFDEVPKKRAYITRRKKKAK